MSATESLAAVDTICVDKTGTLTDGELRLLRVEVAEGVDADEAHGGAGALRRQRRRPQPDAGDDRRALPGNGRPGRRRSPVLLGVEVERPAARARKSYVTRALRTCLDAGRRPDPAAGPRPQLRRGDRGRPPRGRLRRVRRGAARRPGARRRRDWRRSRWSCSRRRCDPTPPRRSPSMREQDVDLKLISGDARETVTAVACAVGVPADAGVIEGSELPEDPRALAEAAAGEHDLLPDRARAEESAGRRAARVRPLHGDDRRRRQRRAGAEAGAARGRDGLRRPGDQGRRRRRPARGRVLAAARSGRRRAADRPQHPPPRPPLPDQDASTRRP